MGQPKHSAIGVSSISLFLLQCIVLFSPINCSRPKKNADSAFDMRMAIIDEFSGSYLVRGRYATIPSDSTQEFKPELLFGGLEQLLQSKEFNLHVINLMNLLLPRESIRRFSEDLWFKKHSEYHYDTHFVFGSFLDPDWFPQWLQPTIGKLHKYLSWDRMDTLVDRLKRLLDIPENVIYIHCSQGVDRTGYVHAAYSMKYQDRQFTGAMLINKEYTKKVKRQYMNKFPYNGLRWYCLGLGKSPEQCRESVKKPNQTETFGNITKPVPTQSNLPNLEQN